MKNRHKYGNPLDKRIDDTAHGRQFLFECERTKNTALLPIRKLLTLTRKNVILKLKTNRTECQVISRRE